MDLYFVKRAIVDRHAEDLPSPATSTVALLDKHVLPDGSPVVLGTDMRPAEPLCSWFRHLAYLGRTADTMRSYAYTAAMERLLAGKPRCTDGRLVKENLYREARVSRATMNRATDILAEWDQRTAATDARTPGEARRDNELDLLRAKVKELNLERAWLQGRLDAAATVIAALHHDNTALTDQLAEHGAIIALDARRSASPPLETGHLRRAPDRDSERCAD